MNYRTILGSGFAATVCIGCAVSANDPEATELGSGADDVGTLEAALGESTCPTATPTSSSNGTATLTLTAAQQDNVNCKWAYVHQVNSVAAGTYFFLKYNGPVPQNNLNCESVAVRMDVYKWISGAWVLDVSREAWGHWGVLGNPNVCAVPQVNRQIQTAGTYKIIVNGRYSALSYQFRSDVKVTSRLASL